MAEVRARQADAPGADGVPPTQRNHRLRVPAAGACMRLRVHAARVACVCMGTAM